MDKTTLSMPRGPHFDPPHLLITLCGARTIRLLPEHCVFFILDSLDLAAPRLQTCIIPQDELKKQTESVASKSFAKNEELSVDFDLLLDVLSESTWTANQDDAKMSSPVPPSLSFTEGTELVSPSTPVSPTTDCEDSGVEEAEPEGAGEGLAGARKKG